MDVAQKSPSMIKGEQHYDIISAFIQIRSRRRIKSATLYWLARMIEGGEDVKFIARRMR